MVAPPRVSRPPVTQLTPGRVLDERYRIVSLLGEGGVGAVYRAEDLTEGRVVAVKVLHEDVASDPGLRERFERETRALFALTHPHIVAVHDFGIVDRAPYLVMELLDGVTLEALLETERLDVERAIEIVRQVLLGLAHAHAHGMIHRDLKSANVFLVREPDGTERAKLLDFGLVKFLDKGRWGAEATLTAVGEVFGTPAYMSPEQAMGKKADARSDVYSMGVVLFEALTGRWPFLEEDRSAMLRAHITQPVPSIASAVAELPGAAELDAIVQRAMAKESGERFAHAGDMLRALQSVRVSRGPASPGVAVGAPEAASLGAGVWIAIGVAALAMMGCTVGVLLYLLS